MRKRIIAITLAGTMLLSGLVTACKPEIKSEEIYTEKHVVEVPSCNASGGTKGQYVYRLVYD